MAYIAVGADFRARFLEQGFRSRVVTGAMGQGFINIYEWDCCFFFSSYRKGRANPAKALALMFPSWLESKQELCPLMRFLH